MGSSWLVERRRRCTDETGAVWVLVALALPLLLILAAFAIDIGHWYDYKRTLQTRADAAALAGGDAYGNACFASSPSATNLDAIGQTAVNYSGIDPSTPSTSTVPAPYTGVTQGVSASQTFNQPNLKAASLSNYFVMFNSTKYANEAGSTNYDMSASGAQDTSAFCKSTDEDGNTGPMIDVRVTQKHVPLFFQLPFKFLSAINAHARVEAQGVASEITTPIAVRDASVTPCVSAIFVDDTTGSPLTVIQDGKSVTSVKLTTADPSATPTVWTNAGHAAQVPMPTSASGHKVSVETFLNDCGSPPNGDTYSYDTNDPDHGLAYINTYGTTAPGAAGAPVITTGGVKLSGGSFGGACDPYFFVTASSAGPCLIGVTAQIAFQAGVSPATDATIVAKDQLTGNTVPLVYSGSGTAWTTAPGTGLDMAVGSGGHPIELSWSQTRGTVGSTACGPGPGNPKPCTGTFGGNSGSVAAVQQRTVAGSNGENACVDQTVDSGPNVAVTIGNASTGTTAGEDAFAYGSTQSLVVTASTAGLANANSGDPPICLRVAVQKDHQTGIIDCGQGNGNSSDITAIEAGCPPPGVAINTRLQADGTYLCSPALTPLDCVTTTQGTRNILGGFTEKVDPDGDRADCAPNNWALGNQITLDDPRAFVMIITAPANLSNQTGNTTVPVRNFAVFYVTGWEGNGPTGRDCTNGTNEAFPGDPRDALNGEIWGHWVSVFIPSSSGTGNGSPCNTMQLGNCIPVLTR